MPARLAALVVLVAIALAACVSSSGQTSVSGGPAVAGSAAPDFTTATLDGKTVHLSDLKGKAVLLNFWATWCAACRSEMPAIQKTLDRFRERGFEVIAINFREGNQAAMRRFLEGAGVRYGSAIDPDGKIADAYKVTAGLPVSIFIDRQGKVALIQVGLMSEDFIEQQVAALV